MEIKNAFEKSPIFIPLVRDSKISTSDINVDWLCLEAPCIANSPNTLKSVRESTKKLFIDPVTYAIPRLPENIDEKKKHICKVPYYKRKSLTKNIYTDANYRLNEFVIPCIDFQISNKSDILIAPYLYSEEINSESFNLSLNMLVDTIKSSRSKDLNVPIWGMINISMNVLADISKVNYIISRYISDYKASISGVIISIADFDSKIADESVLKGFAHLVFQISLHLPTLIYKIDAFGEVLSAVGASAYVSGIYEGEGVSSKKYLEETGGRRSKKFYYPAIMDRLDKDDLKRIGYMKEIGSEPISSEVRLSHYIKSKSEPLTKMQLTQDTNIRIEYMLKRISNAIEEGDRLKINYAVKLNNAHLYRWIRVLNMAKTWMDIKNEEVTIENLLTEIDSNNT